MRYDTNGSGLLQWFYFRMRNAAEFTGVVNIVIANFTKKDSLFNNVSINYSLICVQGMKPTFWSKKAHDKDGKEWH